MIVFPNTKINIGLRVVARRPDGFHELDTCFYPIAWTDALEILPSKTLEFTTSGFDIPGDTSDNLCLKAYFLLDKEHKLPPVHIHLHKSVPVGAGLGAGSADAAYTLALLNSIFDLHLNEYALENYARQLGSDCAFFVRNKPVLAYERGDKFKPCPSQLLSGLNGKYIVVVHIAIGISTSNAYSHIKPQKPEYCLEELLIQPISEWKNTVLNDFEENAFDTYPKLSELKNELYQLGAIFALMSGSGSAIFGIFDKLPNLNSFSGLGYAIYTGKF